MNQCLKPFLFIIVFLTVSITYADWTPPVESAILKHADLIIVGEYVKELRHEKRGPDQFQHIHFKVIDLIKGKNPAKLIVKGEKLEECISQYYFKNKAGDRFLLILNKQVDGTYLPSAGEFGASEIKGNTLMWYKKEQDAKEPWKCEKQALKVVLKRIETLLKIL